jgi:hypothetical protein
LEFKRRLKGSTQSSMREYGLSTRLFRAGVAPAAGVALINKKRPITETVIIGLRKLRRIDRSPSGCL